MVRRVFAAAAAILFAGAAATVLSAAPAHAQERMALVLAGEGPSSGDDAAFVARALEGRSYQVRLARNLDLGGMRRRIFDFTDDLLAAGDDAIGLVYIVGEGVQINNATFITARDTRRNDALSIAGTALPASALAEQLSGLGGAEVVIVLDLTATPELVRRFELNPGVRPIDPPEDGAVILSNTPDAVAPTPRVGVSSFAASFVAELVNSDAPLRSGFQALRNRVDAESNGARRPWIASRLRRDFVLAGPASDATRSPDRGLRAPRPPNNGAARERSLTGDSPAQAGRDGNNLIREVEVFYGTDRRLRERRRRVEFLGEHERGGVLNYGVATVTIPPNHEVGAMERPNWLTLDFFEDPRRHITVKSIELREEAAFYAELRSVVQASREKDAFVFVHGFNTTFNDAAMRTAQLHYDLGFAGAPIFYSWPSRGSAGPLAYTQDANAADRTVSRLESFLTDIRRRTGANKIHLIAHSMGNRVLVKALEEVSENLARRQERSPFNQIILSAPDIDRDQFIDLARQIRGSGARITLYASQNDRALTVSREINGFPRAGDTAEGILVVEGVDSIDASATRTELFDIGHDYFASDASIIDDMRSLFRTNVSPSDRGLIERADPTHWVLPGGAG